MIMEVLGCAVRISRRLAVKYETWSIDGSMGRGRGRSRSVGHTRNRTHGLGHGLEDDGLIHECLR